MLKAWIRRMPRLGSSPLCLNLADCRKGLSIGVSSLPCKLSCLCIRALGTKVSVMGRVGCFLVVQRHLYCLCLDGDLLACISSMLM